MLNLVSCSLCVNIFIEKRKKKQLGNDCFVVTVLVSPVEYPIPPPRIGRRGFGTNAHMLMICERGWRLSHHRNDLKDLCAKGEDAKCVVPLAASRLRPPRIFGVWAQKAQM